MQSPEFLEALDTYYKLKEKYEDKYNSKKLKIINNPSLSGKEKKQKFQQLTHKCIRCSKDGGTLFTNNNNILKAVCGHLENPCKLNIQLDKGLYQRCDYLADLLNDTINEKKSEIVKIKLDFLFGYISEDKALAYFKKLKADLAKSNEYYRLVETKYLDIISNTEKNLQTEKINIDLHKNILDLKELYKNYRATQNIAFIKTLVELYISEVLTNAKTIRDLKYTYSTVETDDINNYLIQKQYTIEQMQMQIRDNKIISNT